MYILTKEEENAPESGDFQGQQEKVDYAKKLLRQHIKITAAVTGST